MNKDIIEGNWKELKGDIQKTWGKLTDDHFAEINGNREKFVGTLQKSYGIARDDAEKQIRQWEDSMRKNRAA